MPPIFFFSVLFSYEKSFTNKPDFFSFLCFEIPLKISPTRTAPADSPHCCGVPEFINSNWSLLKHPARACGSLLLYSTSAALFLGVVRWLLWWKVFDTYSCFYVKWQGCAWHVCLQNKQQKGPVKRTKPLELQQFDRCFYQSTSICNQFFLTARAKVLFFTIIKCWIYGIFRQLFLHSTICTENDRCLTDHTSGDAEQGSES